MKYVALKACVLNNPYRYIEEGEVVELSGEVSKHFVLAGRAQKKAMVKEEPKPKITDFPVDPVYTEQMKPILAKERRENGFSPVEPKEDE